MQAQQPQDFTSYERQSFTKFFAKFKNKCVLVLGRAPVFENKLKGGGDMDWKSEKGGLFLCLQRCDLHVFEIESCYVIYY